ncbi:hypothetical protein FOZ61_004719 [Perkinsus olseni]|uniref:Cyclic nucleotide-binding domain-containing protein n=1 Tax=Perkinsus olseni TaxID=32597 RepID=A0A7J6LKB3_PEROL|nr:hypothetical protein FOZ61_004719 [Perkinsus olseni]KAF4672538.1 hypothetical protein FOL46_008830 [Perkinsus olseni]
MANNLENIDMPADKKAYIISKLNPVLEEMVTRIVTDLPEDLPGHADELRMLWYESMQNQLAKLRAEIRTSIGDDGTGLDSDAESEAEDDEDYVDDLPANFLMPESQKGKTRASVSAEAYGAWNVKQAFTAPILSKSFMFASVEEREMAVVVDAMAEVKLEAGVRVIKQGDDGDFLFVIEEGTLDCIKEIDGEEKVVKTCESGDVFGELSLLYNCPRAAHVQSKDACVLWKLDRETFNHIVKDAAAEKRERYETFLQKVPLLAAMGAYERSQIADALKPQSFADSDAVIMTQGEPGDVFYILEEGSAYAEKNGARVMEYSPGSYFGELALIKNEPRAATVKAGELGAKLLALDRRSFKRLLGSVEELLRKQADEYQ